MNVTLEPKQLDLGNNITWNPLTTRILATVSLVLFCKRAVIYIKVLSFWDKTHTTFPREILASSIKNLLGCGNIAIYCVNGLQVILLQSR